MIPRRTCVALDEARPYFDAIEAEAEVPPFSDAVGREVEAVMQTVPDRGARRWRPLG